MLKSDIRPVNKRAFLAYVQNVAALLQARISVADAILWASEQQTDKSIKVLSKRLRAGLVQGYPLSQMMRSRPDVFSSMFVSLVVAGEESGLLPDMFGRMAVFLEKSDRFKSKMRAALTYPALVLTVAIAAFVFMLLVVVPNFAALYREMEATLPYSTRILLNVSTGLQEHGIIAGTLVLLTISGGFATFSHPKVKQNVFRLATLLPFVGKYMRTYHTAMFARPLAMMLEAGLPLLSALTICAGLFKNTLLKASIARVARRLRNGAGFTQALQGEELFANLMLQMVKTGEESGDLYSTISLVANTLEEELDRKATQATLLLEPALIILIGLFIGGIIVALYLPMLDLLQIIK